MASFHFNQSTMSKEVATGIWEALKNAIRQIQDGNASQLRFEETYRAAYNLVLHKHGDLLYSGVEGVVEEKVCSMARLVARAPTEKLLETIVNEWNSHKIVMKMLQDILMYMDRSYCPEPRKLSVHELGLQKFLQHVICSTGVQGRLSTVLLDRVLRERNGEAIDRMLLKDCLSMLVDVDRDNHVYAEVFEREFLEQTRCFYRQELEAFMARNTCPDFLRKAEKRLMEEEKRTEGILDKSTKPKLAAVLSDEFVRRYAEQIISDDTSGAVSMFRQNMHEDLARMYKLFLRVPDTVSLLKRAMVQLVRDSGQAIVKDKENAKNPNHFVQQVLDLRNMYRTIVDTAFNQNHEFSLALKNALSYFVNLDSRTAQYLALFIDHMFKKRMGTVEHEMERKLDQVVSIFQYLHDKDVFENYYKKHLAQRLLSGAVAHTEMERRMVSKLKGECGHQFTSRLEGMFKDVALSKDTMAEFSRHSVKLGHSFGFEVSVRVLTTGFWPISNSSECKLPPQVSTFIHSFSNFYNGRHSGRRITWQTGLGTADLRCRFQKGPKELSVHTYQMVILMLFNHHDVLSYRELKQLTQIADPELRRHVLSLAHPRVQVLLKNPNTKALEDDHRFRFNHKYSSRLYRNNIPLLASATVSSAVPQVPRAVLEARKHRVDASIVRVMKSRKQLDHNNLTAEVLKQLTSRFVVEPSFIKKRVESLIEREYLERNKQNRRLLHYLA